eukprot:Pgem_evm1s8853
MSEMSSSLIFFKKVFTAGLQEIKSLKDDDEYDFQNTSVLARKQSKSKEQKELRRRLSLS